MMRPHDLQTLADVDALERLVGAYSRAVDRRDLDLLRALYAPDGTDTHGRGYDGPVDGYIAYVERALTAYEATAHYVLQTAFEIDGDHAEGEVHKLNYHRTNGPNATHVITGSRSLDTYVRRRGAWYFRSRHVVLDWVDRRPADPGDYDDPAATSERGAAGPQDASYRVVPLLARAFERKDRT
ncbi:nuclear transport factor 2 family protein [Thalassorhabdomicrobium marinisediminis]|uniref:Nuclear transport factor 2 family protein n=1 Tax=Thalassorhabdomicrobium marinisediminis TaxID=2170577 RepID=A0A2T7FU97_9RHOB|nr:nuclear transport factor 2 family protein [Thalassorhabdomicrobium marinisediminis]PVA05738.1 nuclear transport factor 2 family protein [Thalassorhabdomicrobium marinisediminis]